jgi:uncharacterized SAM-binding protein YcdF (DUF218 family)
VFSALLALLCWFLYRRVVGTEPRRLRTAILFLLVVWFAWQAVWELISYVVPGVNVVALLCMLLAPFSVLVLSGILLRNGTRMLRKEGRSLGNSLSGLLGIALLALPVVGVLLLWGLHPVGVGVAVLLLWASAQLGGSFLVFWVFSKLYERRVPRPDPDAVVVLGSGLIRGKVPRLLANRLDRGRAAFDQLHTVTGPDTLPGPDAAASDASTGSGTVNRSDGAGAPGPGTGPILIPSGGQGPDEPRPEAEAMAEYLIEQGADPSLVVPETASRTTAQNLIFSRRLADERIGRTAPATDAPATGDDATGSSAPNPHGGHLLVVTNGYHAPRAALLSRRLGVDADVVGAPTAKYFVPSAFLREFVAVLEMHRRLQIGLAVPGVALAVATTWFLFAIS